jgi:hypothetical protein
LQDGCEVGRAAQGGALECVLVSVVEIREALDRGVKGASQVEAVGDGGAPGEAWDASETKGGKATVEGVGLKDRAD